MLNLPDFSQAHILVAGDVMLDRYWHGDSQRISPEAPVPIVNISQLYERPGGAANVALNIAKLGAKVSLLAVTGNDDIANRLQNCLQTEHIHCDFQRLNDHPTISKLRILSRHQQLLRLDFEQAFSNIDYGELDLSWQRLLQTGDAIILSDYNKGVLAQPQALIKAARAKGKAVIVDPKGTNFDKYKGASIITPNLSEFEAVVGKINDLQDLEQKGEALRQHLELDALLITRSEQGMSLLRHNLAPLHLPTHAQEVYDVTGAGDTVVSLLACAIALEPDWIQATQLANLAAGLVVAKSGTASVSPAELQQALSATDPHQGGICDPDSLQQQRKLAKQQNKTVVMTNGCFDIIHAGHIHYLEQAKQLGDYLIVAVNDDASVKRLKGETRPVNNLQARMQVLQGLAAVDWVVPFSEDTPEKLICQLLPDTLVKGGDYQIHEIAGHECIQAAGGQVSILDFVDKHSTTKLIQRLQTDNTT